jgi:hypothetical protein
MEKRKGLEAALDFFDANLLDAHFRHPFYEPTFTLDEPYSDKRLHILYPLHSKYGVGIGPKSPNREQLIRINRTIVDFNLLAYVELEQLMNSMFGMNRSVVDTQIENAFYELQDLTSLRGRELCVFLKTKGYSDKATNHYLSYIWSDRDKNPRPAYQEQETRRTLPYSDKNELAMHLEALGLKVLPSEYDAIKSAYRRTALIWHPDYSVKNNIGLPEAEEKMKAANLAAEFFDKHFGK